MRLMAKIVLRMRKPIVVGITGSVGKSSAKEAIALVLSRNYQVRFSPGNYNNEFGLPAAILGIESPGRSLARWIGAFVHTVLIAARFENYPEVLVLEWELITRAIWIICSASFDQTLQY